MFLSGDFRHVITLQSKTLGEDVYGGEKDIWADFATVRAKYLPVGRKERMLADSERSTATDRFYIRYLAGVTTSMRLIFNSQNYDIDAVLDIGGRGREIEILATTGASDG